MNTLSDLFFRGMRRLPSGVVAASPTWFRLGMKSHAEYAYWAGRKRAEGDLAGRRGHYENFYTAHFGLTGEDYRGKRLLDVGCGPRGSLEWADMAAERVGLDPLVGEYRKLGIDRHKMRYVASPAEAMPFEDGHFDIVASFNSLDHVDNLEQTLREIMRVLKAGGRFLLITEVNHAATPTEPVEVSEAALRAALTPHFRVLSWRTFEMSFEHDVYRSVREGVERPLPADTAGIVTASLLKH